MKVSHRAFARVLAPVGIVLCTACVPAPEPTPAPTSQPVEQAEPEPEPLVAPEPAPVTAPAAEYENWIDAPRTEGLWAYSASQLSTGRYSIADYLNPDGSRQFTMMCSPSGNVILQRWVSSVGALPLTIRTETTESTLTAPRDPEGRSMVAVPVRGNDRLLDAIALTRGRFAVETPDRPTLYLPAWAEVTRVIEDCR